MRTVLALLSANPNLHRAWCWRTAWRRPPGCTGTLEHLWTDPEEVQVGLGRGWTARAVVRTLTGSGTHLFSNWHISVSVF